LTTHCNTYAALRRCDCPAPEPQRSLIAVFSNSTDGVVPADVRGRWLPEEWYRTRVRTVPGWDAFSLDEIRERWTNEVLTK